MVKVPSNCQQLKKYKVASAILNVLFLHTGSILKIKIELGELDVDSEFDQIISYLSRNNHLQKMCIQGSFRHPYKLPFSFFSLQGLKVLELFHCLFIPPIICDGFSKLSTVIFANVDITSKALKLFLSNCPLLKDLSLLGPSPDFGRGKRLSFLELLQCVPLIESLKLESDYIEYLSAGGMPYKLPTSLVQLKYLSLGVSFDVKDEVSFALCLIRSSPNLEEISLTVYDEVGFPLKNFPDIQNYSGFTLDQLELFSMKNFNSDDLDVEFLKLVMAKSPMLNKARIELDSNVSLEEENEILRGLLQVQFPRASPSAKLIIERPKHDS